MLAPILIVGAHRSGTTATARALELLGLQIGQRLDSHEESRELQKLHETYLRQHGAAWHDPASFLRSMESESGKQQCAKYLQENIRRRFARIFGYRKDPYGFWLRARIKLGRPWGWKEPRTTLFAPAWLELFPGARILHVVRHPMAVARSIQERELRFRKAGDPPTPNLENFDYCLSLAINYVELGEDLAARAQFYQRVRLEDLQADAKSELEKLASFCGLPALPAQMVAAAASIKPPRSITHPSPVPDIEVKALSKYPIAARLGYGER